jgi:hypothetical protein
MRLVAKIASLAVVTAAVLAVSSPADAASTIRSPNPPQYKVEIEPHGIVQTDLLYDEGRSGFGVGGRFSIPLMSPGFIKTINDSIAISFGPDFVHYDSYRYVCAGDQCAGSSFWRMYFPVAMQWNFWLSDKWSVFGEPGLVIRHTFVDCGPGTDCGRRDVDFAFFAGGRFHFSENVALTIRLGFPEAASVGVSWFL